MINLFNNKVSKVSKASKASKASKVSKASTASKASKASKVSQLCQNYYIDLTGNKNNKVYKMCNKYNQCRKYKCNNIDARIEKKKEDLFGLDYDNYIQTKLEKKCPLTLKNKQRKKCETQTLKKLYSKHNIIKLYNKLLDCNKTLCFKDKQNFYNTMLKKNTIKLTKSEKNRINEIKKVQTPDPDMYLIKNGDL